MESSGKDKSVSAVLICSAGDICDELVSSWRRFDVDLAAVVLSGTSRRKPFSSAVARLWRSGVPVLVVDNPTDWESLGAQLGALHADILVCWAFMRHIPQSFLSRFRRGGVNFHPSLLPAYAGPSPTRCMVADGTYGRFGGLTMHAMTDVFDAGGVLARAKLLPEDYRSRWRFKTVLAATMGAMIRDVLPLYCAGLVREDAQQGDSRVWAAYPRRCVIADEGWSADDIAAAGAFLDCRRGIRLRLGGRTADVFEMRRRLGPPTGKAPVFGPVAVEFDCADARVAMFRTNRAGRLAMRLRNAVARRLPPPEPRPVSFFRKDQDR